MHTFFIQQEDFQNNFFEIKGDDAWHLSRVLRVKVGEHLKIAVGESCLFEGKIIELGKTVKLEMVKELPLPPNPNPIALYLSLIQKDPMELVVQKAVELNIAEIHFVISRYSVQREISKNQWARFMRIADEAQKQCGRIIALKLFEPKPFSKLIQKHADAIQMFLSERTGGKELPAIVKKNYSTHVWIGPEGGWHDDEYAMAAKNDFHLATLGKLVLRAETAALHAISSVIALGF